MEISAADPDPDPPVHAARGGLRPPSKPNGGTRLLVFALQASVMAAALFLFFLFAGIAAVLLLHLLLAGRALRHRRRRHRLLRDPDGEGGSGGSRQGLTREELKRLPSCRHSTKSRRAGPEAAAAGWDSDCAVCLEGLRDGERCRVLPLCGHGFHKACVDKWLVRSPACPVCRAGVGGGGGGKRR